MSIKGNIEQQLLIFLKDILEKEKIDFIVPAERKGTAVLRALIQEIDEPRLEWPWDRVLSSAAIDHASNIDFTGQRILVFDEMVQHGNTLRRTIKQIEKKQPAAVVTAGFAVYEKCETLPDKWFYGSLDAKAYENVRDDVVSMLQKYGSLLLDTEHPELTVKIKCSLTEFYEALSRASLSGTYSFTSGAERQNLTLTKPIILNDESLKSFLPSKFSLDGVVQKCRILERPHPGEFSILPIFYPNVSCEDDSEWIERIPSFMQPDVLRDAPHKQRFYVTGLLAAVEVLRGIIASLSDLKRAGKIIIEAPIENVSHLVAMFPSLDVDKFRSHILDMIAHPMKLRKARMPKVEHLAEETIVDISRKIISGVMSLIDERAIVKDVLTDLGLPIGVTCKEIISLAQTNLGIDPGHASIAMDELIDAGILVTNIEEIRGLDQAPWIVRSFKPDGEIVSSRIRRLASVRGRQLKCLV
jgi:hypothetical protein